MDELESILSFNFISISFLLELFVSGLTIQESNINGFMNCSFHNFIELLSFLKKQKYYIFTCLIAFQIKKFSFSYSMLFSVSVVFGEVLNDIETYLKEKERRMFYSIIIM